MKDFDKICNAFFGGTRGILREIDINRISDIIIYRGGVICTVSDGKNTVACKNDKPYICPPEEFDKSLISLCGGSVWRYSDEFINGAFSLFGYRIGIIGRAVFSDGKIKNICDISSLHIRIPRRQTGASNAILPYILKDGILHSAIIFSNPGGGKTTVLRDLCEQLASLKYSKRVVLIDSQNEILPDLKTAPLCSVFSEYPQECALKIAKRTQNPDLIVCDEINFDISKTSFIYSGIPLIFSTHAQSFDMLMRSFFEDKAKISFIDLFIMTKIKDCKNIFTVYNANGDVMN